MHFARGFAHTRCFCPIIWWHCKRCHAFSTLSVQMGEKMDKATSCHGKDLEGELLSLSTFLPYRFHIIFHPHPPAKTLHLDSPRSVSQDFSDSQDKAQGQRDEKTQRSESEIWWATFFWRWHSLLVFACKPMCWDDLRWLWGNHSWGC